MQISIKFNDLIFLFYHCIPTYSNEISHKLSCHIPIQKLPPFEAWTHISFHQKDFATALPSELSGIYIYYHLKQVIWIARSNYKLFQVNFVSNFLQVLYTNPYKSYVDTLQIYMIIHAHIFNKYHKGAFNIYVNKKR